MPSTTAARAWREATPRTAAKGGASWAGAAPAGRGAHPPSHDPLAIHSAACTMTTMPQLAGGGWCYLTVTTVKATRVPMMVALPPGNSGGSAVMLTATLQVSARRSGRRRVAPAAVRDLLAYS